jgi:hypothetical protein
VAIREADFVAGSELRFEDRGEHQLKGVPETWHLLAVARRRLRHRIYLRRAQTKAHVWNGGTETRSCLPSNSAFNG